MAALLIASDTSFLVSFYAENEHTQKARRLARRVGAPICVSALLEFEFIAALRLSQFRGMLEPAQVENCILDFKDDLSARRLRAVSVDLEDVLQRAKRLAEKYCASSGLRAFDLLHVAAALSMEAELFLTFDRSQQRLALAEGLKSPW